MLSPEIKRKLNALTNLPSIPVVISTVLNEIDNEHYNAKYIAALIEQDQGLTAQILRAANSPLYGLTRTISTVDLAIVILGSNVIKEILISTLLKKISRKIPTKVFNIKLFWEYSIFCGAASRYIARKLKYKLVSEAFITGLMHDIGILIIVNKFEADFVKIRKLQTEQSYSLIEAETEILGCTHADVGAWIAEKWNFPEKIIQALQFHHTHFFIADEEEYEEEFIFNPTLYKVKYPLAAIASMAEWLSFECGMKSWDSENIQPIYYIYNEFIAQMVDDEYLTHESALAIIKQGAVDEYEKTLSMLI